jgi:MFS transporter, DHA1 family, tetracycline resistance protein
MDASESTDRRTGWLLLIGTVTLASSMGAVFPLLPELQRTYGIADWGLGVIASAGFLAMLVAQLGLGRFADQGHTRTMILGALALAVLSLTGFALGSNVWHFSLARACSGFAFGLFSPACRAFFVSRDPQRAGAALGRLTAVEVAGFTASPAVAALLARVSLQLPFVVLAAIVAVVGVALRSQLPDIAARVDANAHGARGIVRRLLRQRPVLVAALMSVVLFIPIGMYEALWARYLEDRGASSVFVGVSLSMFGLPFVVMSARGGRLIDRWGPLRAITRLMVVIVPLTWAYGLIPNPTVIVALAIIEGTASAVTFPAAQTAMAHACPPEWVATGQGIAGAMTQATGAASALIAAPLYGAYGSGITFGAAAGAMTVGLMLVLLLARGHQPVLSGTAPPAVLLPSPVP